MIYFGVDKGYLSTKKIPAGNNIVGLRIGGVRPTSILLDYNDFKAILESSDPLSYFHKLKNTLNVKTNA